jgi:tetrathionate reductase subunit A
MITKKEGAENSTVRGRRKFLKTTALLGGTAALSTVVSGCDQIRSGALDNPETIESYPLNEPENILYSSCLMCNTGCGIKVKILDDVAVKIDGNPLAPHALYPHIKYESSLSEMANIDGAICPKGQAGLMNVYDPYRIRKVLKRAGKRGENKWITIPFDQAVQEVVEGGYLFQNVPGEEERYVSGLKEIWALRDQQTSKNVDEELKKLKKVIKKVRKGELPESAVQEEISNFQKAKKEYLDILIDPDHPDLGPKNNQLAFVWGRVKDGRGDFIKRFMGSFGSLNAHGHTTVCQGSLYFTGKAMSEQWDYDEKSKEVKWTGGKKFYWQADTGNAEFIIFVGASPFEGNYGPPGRTPRIVNNVADGKMKIAVVDPRFSKTASKAWKWIPIQPGMESALALAMARWIIENGKYDKKYLENANKAAANVDGEPTWCNATWLVKINEKGEPDKFLRANEIGLSEPIKRQTKDGVTFDYELFVAMRDGKPLPVNPYDEENAVEGDLLVESEINGIRVKSAFQLFFESSKEHTLEEWAEICGSKPQDIVELAKEFTSHGKKAVADIHRGVSQHTNGFYNCLAWNSLNLMVGNYDWKGGYISASKWNHLGEKDGFPFNIEKLHPGKLTSSGISIIRHDVKYEETTLYDGYPAKRPFFPLASDIYQEIIPSIRDEYPYPVKAMFLYMGSPVYALPGGNRLIEVLMDVNKLPLFITIDITIGETSLYSDYIFPDLTYLERWEFQGSHPGFAHKIQPVRQPVIPPITETVEVFGEKMPISLETTILAIAEKMGLPGFGQNGFGNGMDFKREEDLYLKMVANVAFDGKPVPEADEQELKIFEKTRRHLPDTIYDAERWKKAVGDDEKIWRQVVYVLNRGGRYQNYEDGYDGDLVKNKYGTLVNLYSEKAATTKNSITGKKFSGIAKHYTITDSQGNEIKFEEYNLHLITHREISMTKSRTPSNYWLLSLMPENAIVINKRDADKLGLKDGEEVLVISPSNPEGVWDIGNGEEKKMIGKLKVVQGIRPGVVTFGLGWGHWAYGSRDTMIDGKRIEGDLRRGKGIHANAAMLIDPYLKSTLSDLVGASVSFYDTKVKLLRV